MTNDEIKSRLDSLRFELENDMGEYGYKYGVNTIEYDKLIAQYEMLEGVYHTLGLDW